jgi:hypothetical protein
MNKFLKKKPKFNLIFLLILITVLLKKIIKYSSETGETKTKHPV